MIDIGIAPDTLVCGRATDVVIDVTNRSPVASAYSVVVEFEPDGLTRLDRGAPRIEIDELPPGAVHEHRVTLTGRSSGTSYVDLPYLSYWEPDGRPVRPPTRPLPVRIDPGLPAVIPPTATPPATPPATPLMPAAFISHRRADSGWLGQFLHARLTSRLPGSDIFLDYESLTPGDEWRVAIERALERARALLALIGPGWEHLTDGGTGTPRIRLPHDVVRYEVALALRRDIVVIPLLHDRAELPRPESLPDDLQGLGEHQAVRVHHQNQRHTVSDVVDRLRRCGLR